VKRDRFVSRRGSAAITAGAAIATAALTGVALTPAPLHAAGGAQPLSSVAVPGPANLGDFVKDRAAAIRLGKALFWDEQVGSDGIVACATCHNHAGEDVRTKNQVHQGSLMPFGLNHQFTTADFPFHKLADVNNRNSAVLSDRNDIGGSQGVFDEVFNGVVDGSPEDNGTPNPNSSARIGGIHVRQATGRNTPSSINAVFNYRNFWDGRAQNEFNGNNPFGDRDPNAHVWQVVGGTASPIHISLTNSSAASQSVGPPLSGVEMSWSGRTWPTLGHKMLTCPPLNKQHVAADDSSLGALANPSTGLSTSYAQMIKDAFQSQWWDSGDTITISGHDYSVMEANFSLFWGLAIQMYESTLISDQTPYDLYLAGDSKALNSQQKKGLSIFNGKGGCAKCHSGAELTSASVSQVSAQLLTRENLANGTKATFDTGFRDIGVRPTAEDKGQGGTDPFGNPLSLTRLLGTPGAVAVDGSFKVPGLRNVELNGPYFHNGSRSTLRQVVDFYNRGGDFANANQARDIKPLGLKEDDKNALVSFLMALTDERVRWEAGPFDHPEFNIANGHTGSETSVVMDPLDGCAEDDMITLPATGIGGGAAPLAPFTPAP
jgi:cytochrome c peroxidase